MENIKIKKIKDEIKEITLKNNKEILSELNSIEYSKDWEYSTQLFETLKKLESYRNMVTDEQIEKKNEILTIIKSFMKTQKNRLKMEDYAMILTNIVIFPEISYMLVKYFR